MIRPSFQVRDGRCRTKAERLSSTALLNGGAEIDRGGLSDFLDGGWGAPPPVFVGREALLERAERCAGQAWKDRRKGSHGQPKMTQVVRGAPGAGKSALLDELLKRSKLERAGAPGQSRVVLLSSHDLLTDLGGVIEMTALAGGIQPDRWRRISSGLSVGVDVAASRAEGGISLEGFERSRPRSIQQLVQVHGPERWHGSVIVCIDEAQRLPQDGFAPHALFLQAIHDGMSRLPLSLVLGGLGDTHDVAIGMGLTRPDNVWLLGGLSPDESLHLVLRFCDAFGLDAHGCEGRAGSAGESLRRLARASSSRPSDAHGAGAGE